MKGCVCTIVYEYVYNILYVCIVCMYESVCMYYNVYTEYIVCIGVCMYGFMYVWKCVYAL